VLIEYAVVGFLALAGLAAVISGIRGRRTGIVGADASQYVAGGSSSGSDGSHHGAAHSDAGGAGAGEFGGHGGFGDGSGGGGHGHGHH